jgi:hypothetical protein
VANSPILILAFQRAESVINICKISISAGCQNIYISIDGPNSEFSKVEQLKMAEQIANIINLHPEVSIKVRKSVENQGLVKAILGGIDWVFCFEEDTIILEEDLVPNSDFFRFCQSGLDEYRSYPNVLTISGNNFNFPGSSSVRVSHYPLIWGWATWRSKWVAARPFLSGKAIRHLWLNSLSPVASFWNAGLVRARFSVLHSWALPFAVYSLKNEFLNIIPPVNLVSNLGFDSLATHTVTVPSFDAKSTARLGTKIHFPKLLEEQELIDHELESKFYRIKIRNQISPLTAIIDVIMHKVFTVGGK